MCEVRSIERMAKALRKCGPFRTLQGQRKLQRLSVWSLRCLNQLASKLLWYHDNRAHRAAMIVLRTAPVIAWLT